jgi:CheY-like chemotaxis protein
LHLEDDPSLANIVKLSFESFGFEGEILNVTLVEDAIKLLKEREKKGLSIDLIISDMQLPDGQALVFLKHIKASSSWQKTPVIVLSGDCSQDTISEAYALGANCYLSKFPRKGKVLENFRSIYQFWLETALLPEFSYVGGMQAALNRSVRLRARTSQFYIKLSKEMAKEAGQELFWLERAMVEGNLSSLISFFCGLIDDNKVSVDLSERLSEMQVVVEAALVKAEHIVENMSQYKKHDIYCAVLGLIEVLDEELLADLLTVSFPLNPAVSESIITSSSAQLRELVNYVKTESDDNELRQRAEKLANLSQRIEGLLGSQQDLRA